MNCPECQTVMVRVYSVEEIEEEFKPEGLNIFLPLRAQFALLRNMTCPNCHFSKQLSVLDILFEFARMKKGGA